MLVKNNLFILTKSESEFNQTAEYSHYLCDDYGGYGCKECPFNFLENRNCNATEFANWLNSEVEE